MLYRHLKANPLTEQEKQRLQVCQLLGERIQKKQYEATGHPLTDRFLQWFSSKDHPAKQQLADWLFSYATPELMQTLISSEALQDVTAMEYLNPKHLQYWLPEECLVPDIQWVQQREKPRHTLVCLCSMSLRLNLSVQTFHLAIGRHFDQVIYLRDHARQSYAKGIPQLGNSLSSMQQAVIDKLSNTGRICILGTSSGGFAAAGFLRFPAVQRTVLFSPNWWFEGQTALSADIATTTENLRVYFSSHNRRDQEFLPEWRQAINPACIRELDSDDHGSLQVLLLQQGLNELMAWMKN